MPDGRVAARPGCGRKKVGEPRLPVCLQSGRLTHSDVAMRDSARGQRLLSPDLSAGTAGPSQASKQIGV